MVVDEAIYRFSCAKNSGERVCEGVVVCCLLTMMGFTLRKEKIDERKDIQSTVVVEMKKFLRTYFAKLK